MMATAAPEEEEEPMEVERLVNDLAESVEEENEKEAQKWFWRRRRRRRRRSILP